MFVLKRDHTFFWAVRVRVPADGKHVEQAFEAEFKALSKGRIDELVAQQPDGDAALLEECLVGWRGVVDAEKQELPVTAAVKRLLIDTPYVRIGLVAAYFEALAGRREKN